MNREAFKRLCLWTSVMIVLGIFVVLTMYSKLKFGSNVICPINVELGLECPGCGGTRMIDSLLKLDFYQAFRWNPFLFITFPPIIIYYICQSYEFIVHNKMLKNVDIVIVVYIAAFIIFGILRNVEIFQWLRPTLIEWS